DVELGHEQDAVGAGERGAGGGGRYARRVDQGHVVHAVQQLEDRVRLFARQLQQRLVRPRRRGGQEVQAGAVRDHGAAQEDRVEALEVGRDVAERVARGEIQEAGEVAAVHVEVEERRAALRCAEREAQVGDQGR